MNIENKKLKIILDNLKNGYDLSVYNFKKEIVIIKDIKKNILFTAKVLFSDDKVFFRDIKEKEINEILPGDLL